jgi:hypothetical protein
MWIPLYSMMWILMFIIHDLNTSAHTAGGEYSCWLSTIWIPLYSRMWIPMLVIHSPEVTNNARLGCTSNINQYLCIVTADTHTCTSHTTCTVCALWTFVRYHTQRALAKFSFVTNWLVDIFCTLLLQATRIARASVRSAATPSRKRTFDAGTASASSSQTQRNLPRQGGARQSSRGPSFRSDGGSKYPGVTFQDILDTDPHYCLRCLTVRRESPATVTQEIRSFVNWLDTRLVDEVELKNRMRRWVVLGHEPTSQGGIKSGTIQPRRDK